MNFLLTVFLMALVSSSVTLAENRKARETRSTCQVNLEACKEVLLTRLKDHVSEVQSMLGLLEGIQGKAEECSGAHSSFVASTAVIPEIDEQIRNSDSLDAINKVRVEFEEYLVEHRKTVDGIQIRPSCPKP